MVPVAGLTAVAALGSGIVTLRLFILAVGGAVVLDGADGRALGRTGAR